MSKPCRECYLVYLANAKKAVAKEKERFSSKAPAPEQAVSDVWSSDSELSPVDQM